MVQHASAEFVASWARPGPASGPAGRLVTRNGSY